MASSKISLPNFRLVKGSYTGQTSTSNFNISSTATRRPLLLCASGCIGVIEHDGNGAIVSQYFSNGKSTATINGTTLTVDKLQWYDNPFILTLF